MFEDYGPSEGNPATDPAPEWIKGLGLYSDWRLVDPDKPGNYYPMVTKRLEYCMYAIAPLTVLMALIMLCDGYKSVQDFQSTKRGCKSSSPGICCSIFLVGIAWFSVISWSLFVGFNALGVYYYRIVQERCYDRYERTFDIGVYPSICIDLMQLGLVRMKNTNNEAFGKICGEGQTRLASYGQLEEYCQGYKTPYALMICALSGAGLIMIGFMQFGMTLAANYSLLQKKYSRPLGRYRAEKAQVKAAKDDDQARLLNPPSYAPSTRPPPKASTYMPTDNSYLQPNDLGASFGGPSRNGDIMMNQSRGAPIVRSDASVDNYYKRY